MEQAFLLTYPKSPPTQKKPQGLIPWAWVRNSPPLLPAEEKGTRRICRHQGRRALNLDLGPMRGEEGREWAQGLVLSLHRPEQLVL